MTIVYGGRVAVYNGVSVVVCSRTAACGWPPRRRYGSLDLDVCVGR
jgi:hypothetical protein